MGKLTKKYIGTDQVGSVQIELENADSLRARSADGLSSVNLMELDASDLLQMVQHPYLPADATQPLQAVTKQQVMLLDGTQAMTGNLNMGDGTFKITNLADGSDPTDAVTFGQAALALDEKANLNLDNLSAGNTSIPAGVDLRSMEAGNGNVFRLFTADQTGTGSAVISVGSGSVSTSGNSGAAAVVSGPVLSGSGLSGVAALTSGYNAGSGASGVATISTGKALSASSGLISIATGGINSSTNFGSTIDNSTSNATTGGVFLNSGDVGTGAAASTAQTGLILLRSGDTIGLGETGTAMLRSGSISNASSSANTGIVTIGTGSTDGSGNSGDINIQTGSVVSGVQGKIVLGGSVVEIFSQLDMQANRIIDVLDPVDPQDAATKAYVDAQINAGTNFHKQAITLTSTDITNQYVDLTVVAIEQSCQIGVGERVMLWEDLDYSVSPTGGAGGNTRISFTGPSAASGAEELVEGQTLYVQCVIDNP